MLNKHWSIFLKIQINAIDILFTKIDASGWNIDFFILLVDGSLKISIFNFFIEST